MCSRHTVSLTDRIRRSRSCFRENASRRSTLFTGFRQLRMLLQPPLTDADTPRQCTLSACVSSSSSCTTFMTRALTTRASTWLDRGWHDLVWRGVRAHVDQRPCRLGMLLMQLRPLYTPRAVRSCRHVGAPEADLLVMVGDVDVTIHPSSVLERLWAQIASKPHGMEHQAQRSSRR
jgi:hypothetical protein